MKSIKTLVSVAFAALTLSLTGCSKDPEDLIIGDWEMTSIVWTLSSSESPEPWSETITPNEGESTVFTFNKDNTMVMVDVTAEGTDTQSGTYKVDDDKLSMTYVDEDGDTVTDTYTIDKIDKKSMTISESASATEDGVTYSESVVVNFTRK